MTTILSIRGKNKVVIAGDGQVSFGDTIMKATAQKIRKITCKNNDLVLTGFAGSTADAFALFERLEIKLDKYPGQLKRACVELAKDWRTDKYLRRLEAMIIVVNKDATFIITGSGDVISPEDGLAAIGSGGNYALSAARAMMGIDADIDIEEIAKKAMKIAADICVYTNNNIV
uniref:HslU--HslV peptidase n=1 Tax=Biomphalaria glabrata TaxID=6526 RepID=A0A2C9KTD1_BIOGL